MRRPSFVSAWAAFMAVKLSVADVGKKIGGHVQKNIDAGIFQNACPIRMSHVLNSTGYPVARNGAYETVSGADGKQYIFRVSDMLSYMASVFGNADKTARSPLPTDFADLKGIIVVKGHGWSNAQGHETLWNGEQCSDTCHLMSDPDNGSFIPETASIWVLP